MTTHRGAVLAYGYDLGGAETKWKFSEVDEDELFAKLPWFDEETFDDEDGTISFADVVTSFIAHELGDDPGVYVKPAGYQCATNLLVAYDVESHYSDVTMVNFRELSLRQMEEDWSVKLTAALKAMGMTLDVDRPRWMLIANYD